MIILKNMVLIMEDIKEMIFIKRLWKLNLHLWEYFQFGLKLFVILLLKLGVVAYLLLEVILVLLKIELRKKKVGGL